MMEILVALTVLTIGLLGVAVMQQYALGKNVDAKELSVATNLGTEMLERIQYSKKNVLTYNGIDTTAGTPCPTGGTTPVMTTGDCTQWMARLIASRLPSVRGTVTVVTTGPASLNEFLVTVQIKWTTLVLPITFTSIVSL